MAGGRTIESIVILGCSQSRRTKSGRRHSRTGAVALRSVPVRSDSRRVRQSFLDFPFTSCASGRSPVFQADAGPNHPRSGARDHVANIFCISYADLFLRNTDLFEIFSLHFRVRG